MNEKEIITEKTRMKNIRNFGNKTNPNYSRQINLSQKSNSQKKKNKYKSYNDFYDLNNQKYENKILFKGRKNYIYNYQPQNRNFAVIRNSKDIMKYMPDENSKEIDNNYFSLINDFEVKFPIGNTSFYLIYDWTNKNHGFNNINTLKYQKSSKERFHQFIMKNKNKQYKQNISKISLPFCVYRHKSSYIEKENENKKDSKEEEFYLNRNNYELNNKQLEKLEESKNNEVIMIEEYNNYNENPYIVENNEKMITNPNIENNEDNEDNANLEENENEEENKINEDSVNKEYNEENEKEENKEDNQSNGNNENIENSDYKKADNFSENSRNHSRNNTITLKPTNTQKNTVESKENKINEEEELEHDNSEVFKNEEEKESITKEDKKTIESEEKEKEVESSDRFSLDENDTELSGRRDLSTHCIVNVIKLPKQSKKFNFRRIRQNQEQIRNKTEISSKKYQSKKKENKEPINKHNNNVMIYNENKDSTIGRKKIKIKSVELLRDY